MRRPPALRAATPALAATLAATFAVAQEEGREVFLEAAEPQCAVCHTLADAGAAGEIGPNLDTLAELTPDRVRAAVTQGVGVMPPYADLLTPEQIDAVSEYVASVAEGG